MNWIIISVPFVYLWYRVIDSVSLEWSSNPQYSYGWIVPFLCLGLILRNWTSAVSSNRHPTECAIPSLFLFLVFIAGLLLFLPARLIAASTPEWRPLQWILALIATGSTLYLVRSVLGRLGLFAFGFPICFFLVAIPWPGPVEQPIIQNLTHANASVVVELMSILGIPAVQHGNIIEIASGTVGIDEACSGIRSFQSSLMISLFLGEFYLLNWSRRFILLGSGIALSFLFNVCRTSFLTWIAAQKGIAAIGHYHDPAGLAILVACTLTLWLVGLYLSRKPVTPTSSPASSPDVPPIAVAEPAAQDSASPVLHSVSEGGPVRRSFSEGGRFPLSALNRLLPLSLSLILYFSSIEIGTALWFHVRESKLVLGPTWTMTFPTNDASFKPITLAEKTSELLRFDEGNEGEWDDSNGARWHAFFFNWMPGRVAGYLAKRHTPEICMNAAGLKLLAGPDLFVAKVHGVTLPIRQYVYERQGACMNVFHCRWEAGADENAAVQYESARMNLVRAIWAGRGKHGQKVIEFVATGFDTPEQARTAFLRQLDDLIQVEPEKPVAQK